MTSRKIQEEIQAVDALSEKKRQLEAELNRISSQISFKERVIEKGINMSSIRLEVWGKRACFTIPQLKAERYSYDVITPSAATAILKAIYWHPGVEYHIDRIHVLSPIKKASCMTNEINTTLSMRSAYKAMRNGTPFNIDPSDNRQKVRTQRMTTFLCDVRYVIEAHFTLGKTANESASIEKVHHILTRRIQKGQWYRCPYFGIREMTAHFRMWEGDQIPAIPETRDFGIMHYGLDYSDPANIKPMYFFCKMVNGVIDLTECEVFTG